MAFCSTPQRMLHVLSAVEMLIENKTSEVAWNDIKRHTCYAQRYIQRFYDFKVETVTVKMAQLIRHRINSDPECTVEKLKNVSSAVSKILTWLLAVLDQAE